MPELPEVETIRRSLLPVRGRRIEEAEVRERRLRRPVAEDFAERARGRTVETVRRRGKYLLFDLDGGLTLLVHLGMSGALELRRRGAAVQRHDHVCLRLSGGGDLVFNDPRRFGLVRIAPLDALDELARVGPDPLGQEWSGARLRVLTRRRRLPIKSLLMDQRAIGGIGNIYANEMLFRAGVRPRRRAGGLRAAEIDALARAMREVLEEAVEAGGSSISDFRDGNGRTGYFQHRFRVYDHEGEPCTACATAIRRIVLNGRSTFYCPRCQR